MPLIHSSGPAAFDYLFAVPGRSIALVFLHCAFDDGRGEFGWRNHIVGELEGGVVAAGAEFRDETSLAFLLAAARQILAHEYPRQAPGVIACGLKVQRVIPPPSRGGAISRTLACRPSCADREGIGRTMVEELIRRGVRGGCNRMVLDVAVSNPRAQPLYARLGVDVTDGRESALANTQGAVSGHRRMERRADAWIPPLSPGKRHWLAPPACGDAMAFPVTTRCGVSRSRPVLRSGTG